MPEPVAVIKNDPRLINAWSMYDWANSVYNLVITATLFPVFYNEVTKAAFDGPVVSFFGLQVNGSVLYSYALSISFLIIAFLSPLLSGIADYGGIKKSFMKFFAYMGSISCVGLYFFNGYNIEYGIILAMTASIGWSGSVVFYNAYLPEIATPDRFDHVSARGYSLGYIGSVLLLIFIVINTMNPSLLGFAGPGKVISVSFIIVGIWWAGFAQIPFSRLPYNKGKGRLSGAVLLKGYTEINMVFGQIKKRKDIQRYLISFFFYSAGVQAVMYLAPLFGKDVIQLSGSDLIATVLFMQFIAVGGSYLFAWVSKIRGNRFSLISMVFIWIIICISAFFTYTQYQFYGIAAAVGLVMGGIQSLSRSSYSKLIPGDTMDNASYFSFYDLVEKLSIVSGTFFFGLVNQLTGSMRNSVLVLIVLFALGFLLLLRVTIPHSKQKQ